MAELLIHSMSEFENIIIPCLERAKAQHIVEIGAEFGGMSICWPNIAHRRAEN